MNLKILFLVVMTSIILHGCKDDNEIDYLELSQSSFSNVSNEGETLRINVTSDMEWQVSQNVHWCTVTPSTGSGNQTLVIQIGVNTDNKERNATITVTPTTSSGTSKKIEITQAAGNIAIEQYHYEVPVIFHVFYKDKSDPLQYVSQSRLTHILDVVNKLYQNSKMQSVDMNLTFTLATTDPNGKTMLQPGVEYISWPENYPIDCETFMNDETGKHVKYLWEPNSYINIMVYNFTEDPTSDITILGISYLPYTQKGGNSLAGLQEISQAYLELKNLKYPHCVSINSLFINEESTETTYSNADITTTLAHELGHYLGLYHTFSENEHATYDGCIDSDYCEDTPTYNKVKYDADYMYIAMNEPENFTFSYLVMRTNCLTDETFVSHNIMDYAISWGDQFTPDQCKRIRHVLNYSPLIPGPKKETAATRTAPEGLVDLPIRTIK